MIPDTVEDGASDVVGENVSEWGEWRFFDGGEEGLRKGHFGARVNR